MSDSALMELERLEREYGIEPTDSDIQSRTINLISAMDDYLERLHKPRPTQPKENGFPGYYPQDR